MDKTYPFVVTTAAEIDALPPGTYGLDCWNRLWDWRAPEDDQPYRFLSPEERGIYTAERMTLNAPFTILGHRPLLI